MPKMIHSMIRVLDEAKSLEFYSRAFGLRVADRIEFNEFVLLYLSNPETEFELELTVNKGRDSAYDLGDGYGHLAISVENLETEHERLLAAGLNPDPIVQFAPDGEIVAKFFFIQDPDGYKIEVLERVGRFK